MRKKVVSVILAMSMVCMTACGSEKQSVSTTTKQSVSETREKQEDVSKKAEEPEVTQSEKYMKFLDGEEILYLGEWCDKLGGELSPDKGYYLEDIVYSFLENDRYQLMKKEPAINYAYLDCGNDGVQEFAVEFKGMGIYDQSDASTLVFIIKEKDEKLELCYCYETWARSETITNQYGYVYSGGSNGATNHGVDYGYIDAAGTWNFIYYTEQELEIRQLTYPKKLAKIWKAAKKKKYKGEIIFVTTTFDEYSEKEPDKEIKQFYSYFVDGVEGDVYSKGVYKEIFEEAGVEMHRWEEIEQMVQKKKDALGITKKIEDAPELEWKHYQKSIW